MRAPFSYRHFSDDQIDWVGDIHPVGVQSANDTILETGQSFGALIKVAITVSEVL
jgi:hypothetical protein